MPSPSIVLRALAAVDRAFAWELNEANVPHVATETRDEMERLCAISVFARVAVVDGSPAGFLLGMIADADYDSENFLWFRARYPRFLYVDRIAVSADRRGHGVGRALYEGAERYAKDDDLPVLACEVNTRPPNPTSMAFHMKLGFVQVGTQDTDGGAKTVAMLVKTLRASP